MAGLRVDAGIEVVLMLGGGIDAYLEVAAPTESGTDGAATMFLGLSVERQHHLGSIEMGVAGAVAVADDLQATRQRLLGDRGLCRPVAMQVRQPHVTTADGQVTRVIAFQRDGLLFLMRDVRPGLDDVHRLIGLVIHLHRDGQQLVLQGELMDDGRTIVRCMVACHMQFQVLVAIGVLHL